MNKDQIRAAMPPDLLAMADEIRDTFDAKLVWLQLPDGTEFGTPPEPGIKLSEMVILSDDKRWDARTVAKSKQTQPRAGKVPPRSNKRYSGE